MLFIKRDDLLGSNKLHIAARGFDNTLPHWQKRPLCNSQTLNLARWYFINRETIEVDRYDVCATCRKVLDSKAITVEWFKAQAEAATEQPGPERQEEEPKAPRTRNLWDTWELLDGVVSVAVESGKATTKTTGPLVRWLVERLDGQMEDEEATYTARIAALREAINSIEERLEYLEHWRQITNEVAEA